MASSAGDTLKKTGTRAAEGAAIGSIIPGVGTGIGAAAGGIEGFIESLFSSSGDSGQAATDAAGAEKIRRMDDAYKVLMQQRQQQRQTQLNMLANRMGAYQGANNVLASMYGTKGSMAPNLNLSSGGPSSFMSTKDPGVGRPAGAPSGSAGSLFGGGAPGNYGNLVRPPAGPPDPQAPMHTSPGSGYTWTSQGTQGGGFWRPPALSPGVGQINGQVGGGGPQLSAPGAPGGFAAPSLRAAMTGGGGMGLNAPRPPMQAQAPPPGGATTSGMASLIARMGGRLS